MPGSTIEGIAQSSFPFGIIVQKTNLEKRRRAMDFNGFDWDVGNFEKCQKHGVSIIEIESLFEKSLLVGPDGSHSQAEVRFRAIGKTMAGRPLFVVFTWRTRGRQQLIRPLSARYMHKEEIASYEEISKL